MVVWLEISANHFHISWCLCHPTLQNGLPICCQHTQVMLEKRRLNWCPSRGTATTGDTSPVHPTMSPIVNFGGCLCPLKPILAPSAQSTAWFNQKAATAVAIHLHWMKLGPYFELWYGVAPFFYCQRWPTSLSVPSKSQNMPMPLSPCIWQIKQNTLKSIYWLTCFC